MRVEDMPNEIFQLWYWRGEKMGEKNMQNDAIASNKPMSFSFIWSESPEGDQAWRDVHEDSSYHALETFHGIKVHQCWEKFSIDSDFFVEVAEWAETKDLPLFIHLYSDKDVLKLIEYKKEHQKLKLIVAHLFGLELFINKFNNDGNLYFDSSPLQLTSDYRLKMAIDYVGVEKVFMGTDTPYGATDNLRKSIDRIKKLKLSIF